MTWYRCIHRDEGYHRPEPVKMLIAIVLTFLRAGFIEWLHLKTASWLDVKVIS